MKKYLFIIFIFCSLFAECKNAYIFIAGQSNPEGRGNEYGLYGTDSAYLVKVSKSYFFNGVNFADLDYSVNNNQYPILANTYSFELSLAKTLRNNFGYDSVFFIKYCSSGTCLCNYSLNWSSRVAGSLSDSTVKVFNRALSKLHITANDTIRFIWWQGESDSSYDSCATNYYNNLDKLFNYFKANVTTDIFKRSIIVRVRTTATYIATVRSNQALFVNANAGYSLFDTDIYPAALPHLISQGYLRMGYDLACSFFAPPLQIHTSHIMKVSK